MGIWQPGRTLDEVEKDVIFSALQFYHNNKTHTAKALGIAIRTLDNKLEKYNGTASIPSQAADHLLRSETGVHLESSDESSKKSSVPMQERKEVQKLSPQPTSQSHTKSGTVKK